MSRTAPAPTAAPPASGARPRPGVADGGQQRVPQTVDLLGVVQQASKNVIPPGGFGPLPFTLGDLVEEPLELLVVGHGLADAGLPVAGHKQLLQLRRFRTKYNEA